MDGLGFGSGLVGAAPEPDLPPPPTSAHSPPPDAPVPQLADGPVWTGQVYATAIGWPHFDVDSGWSAAAMVEDAPPVSVFGTLSPRSTELVTTLRNDPFAPPQAHSAANVPPQIKPRAKLMDFASGAAPSLQPGTGSLSPTAIQWFAGGGDDLACDRETMPPALAALLLRDDSYQPGVRPTHFSPGGMTRHERVFKEKIVRDKETNEFDTRQRRGKTVDFWHNSGGNRASTWLPKDKPLVKRRYGAIERLALVDRATASRRSTAYNYHEYTLAGEEGDVRPILYHVIPPRKKSASAKKSAAKQAAAETATAAAAATQIKNAEAATATGAFPYNP